MPLFLPLSTPQNSAPNVVQVGPIAQGPFQGNLDSLKQNRYPKWFTDGKLGIWAHWGPQSVPMEGDWYARLLYEQGSKDYNDHVARFGHPTEKGYKDIIPLWTASKWDPDRLMGLYKSAGAKYFVSMGVHHDNFDLWNSRYHSWNAVKMGPKRDVVGTWQKAAKKRGLHFGVSEHLGASFTWFQDSHGSDKTGPLAGVPYDGADPKYEELYHWKAEPGDTGWYSTDPKWHAEWFARIKDLVDQYHPDLLYSDGGIPFGDVGASLVAHFYNSDIALHGGKQQAVYTCKQASDGRWAQDVERGVMSGIQKNPWQTDTSIGDWFYNKNWKYRGADWVIHTLVDAVSKNGNLLINVVQRPDGSLDPEAEKVLSDMADWMKVNSESIYATSPWISYGEGPTKAQGGAFKEDFAFSAKDVRFSSKGNSVLYATLMGKPESDDLLLKSLPKEDNTPVRIESVRLLGSQALVSWKWTSQGLAIHLPKAQYSDIASVVKITGTHLRDFPVAVPSLVMVSPDSNGVLTLSADKAELHGEGINTETRDDQANLGFWDSSADWASWHLYFKSPGRYSVVASVATQDFPTSLRISLQGESLIGSIPKTAGWGNFETIDLGTLEVKTSGLADLALKPSDPKTWKPMNLRSIVLKPIP